MSKAVSRIRRSKKLRATLQKTGGMRIAISRSLKNITAQLIDSSNGSALATISTQQKAFSGANGGNIEAAKFVGAEIAKKSCDGWERRGLRLALDHVYWTQRSEIHT